MCKKVFNYNECPEWLMKPGMKIVENCKGLPLAVAVIAGVLAKEPLSEKIWMKIADKTGSYIVGGQNGCLETLGLSYNHLPLHLRECFLYLGGFPKNHMFYVQMLILLWAAEGFIQKDGNRSLETIAEGYLMDLIDRNLVIVAHMSNSSGDVKACKVHDLVRELSIRKAKEENFILNTEVQTSFSYFSNVTTPPYKPVRMLTDKNPNILCFLYLSAHNIRSILCFNNFTSFHIANYFRYSVLLRVLDLQKCSLKKFPKGMELLVHLRYLAIQNSSADFPSSICNLWVLQTLIYIIDRDTVLPGNISDLVNLKHLLSYHPSSSSNDSSMMWYFILPSIEKPMNLQTFSNVELEVGVDFRKCFPYIKAFQCTTYLDGENDFKSLTYLEYLELNATYGMDNITFPAALKTLTLAWCGLPWSDMSIIQSLPNLEVLKLHKDAFEGSCWNTDEHEFPKLKFLRLNALDIKLWKADSTSFPCLKQLEIDWCRRLEEIPLEIGEIPTLELIKISECRPSVGESVRIIEKEQQDFGNYDLKIDICYELD